MSLEPLCDYCNDTGKVYDIEKRHDVRCPNCRDAEPRKRHVFDSQNHK